MKTIFSIAWLFLAAPIYSQTYFQKIIGTPSTDKSFGVCSAGGGYVLSGHSANNLLLLKVDSSGNTIWKKSYGGATQAEEGKVCVSTPDGGFLLTGYSQLGAGLFDAIITKTDSLGNFLWSKTYGDAQHNKAWPIDINASGDIYIAGWSEPDVNTAPATAFVLKTTSNGDTLWTRKIGTTGKNYFRTLDVTNDGGCIAVGETDNYGIGGFDILVARFNHHGDTLWTRTLGDSGDDFGWSVQQTSDNGYIIVGNTGSFGYGTNTGDAIIIKLSELGDIQWSKTIGDASIATTLQAARSVTQTQDGNIIFCGYSDIPGPPNEEGWIAKLNITNGDTLWTRYYPLGTSNEHFRFISEVAAGEYIVAGYTASLGMGGDDIFLMRVQDGGFPDGCNQSTVPANFLYIDQTLNTTSGIPYLTTDFNTHTVTGSYTPNLVENMLCSLTVDVPHVEKTEKIVYAPNPFSLHTVLQSDRPLTNATLIIFNALGQPVQEIVGISGQTAIIMRNGLAAGLYFMQLKDNGGILSINKLIVGD